MPVDPASPWSPASTFRISWDEEREVIRFVWASDLVCDVRAAQDATAALRAAFEHPLPLLVDMRTMAKLERGAREHFKRDKGGVAAMALLVDSPVTRMMANFFMHTDVDVTPTRMFSDEGAAMVWLGEHQA